MEAHVVEAHAPCDESRGVAEIVLSRNMPNIIDFSSFLPLCALPALLVDPRLLPRIFHLHLHNLRVDIAPYRPLLGLNPSRHHYRITMHVPESYNTAPGTTCHE